MAVMVDDIKKYMVSFLCPIHRVEDVGNAVSAIFRNAYFLANGSSIVSGIGCTIGVDTEAQFDLVNSVLSSAVNKFGDVCTCNVILCPSCVIGNIGMKRDYMCLHTDCDIVVHIDADDWYADDWVAVSVHSLVSFDYKCIGLMDGVFVNSATNESRIYRSKSRVYRLGATLAYMHDAWRYIHSVYGDAFGSVKIGEESVFLRRLSTKFGNGVADCIGITPYFGGFKAIITGNNTSSHKSWGGMVRVRSGE